MDIEEIGINAGNWVDSAEDRDYWRALVNAALNRIIIKIYCERSPLRETYTVESNLQMFHCTNIKLPG